MKIPMIFIALLFTCNLFAQENAPPKINTSKSLDSLHFVFKTGNDLTDFSVDNLGNIYMFGNSGQLKKISPAGDSLAVFNDVRRYGTIHSLDVSNPLKILLFYKDFGTIAVLDRFLNIRNTIDLRKLDILQVKAIAQSFDNGIWVYDELDGKLKRINDAGKLVGESADFRVLFDNAPSPSFISDVARQVFLYDSLTGLIVMDYFGTLRNKVALTGLDDVQVIGNNVIGRKGTLLVKYTPGTLQLREQALPPLFLNAQKVQLSGERIYMLKEGTLYIFTLDNQ